MRFFRRKGGEMADKNGRGQHALAQLPKDWDRMSDAEKDAFVEKVTAEVYDKQQGDPKSS